MAKDTGEKRDAAWTVLPHQPIEKLAENLWHVSGSLTFGTLKRAMTIAKRSDGRLVIHSAIAMDESEMKEIEAWGEPAFLIVPNHYHRLDAARYKARYPNIVVLAPELSREKVATKVHVDGNLDDFPADDAVRYEKLAGIDDAERAMVVKSKDGTSLVLNDIVFNMDKKTDFMGWLFTTLMSSAPGPRVSHLAKIAMVKDKKALRGDLERLAGTPNLQRVIVSHEKVASGKEAAEALKKAATFL